MRRKRLILALMAIILGIASVNAKTTVSSVEDTARAKMPTITPPQLKVEIPFLKVYNKRITDNEWLVH